MKILTQKYLTNGCQFQKKGDNETHPLYISRYNEAGHLILVEYKKAYRFNKDLATTKESMLCFFGTDFFVFQYPVFGDIEMIQRYFRDFEIVNY